ncbi:MAG TPA: NUDIX domain-containing protein [Patescibacteria group bacterium]|nr:NUDIX domain-containing protein [Patescibacteria group bacterium]
MGKNAQPQKTGSSNVLKSPVTREFSSGGVVFKKTNGQGLWLIRKTTASELYPNQYWMLPKGRIDDAKDDEPGPMAKGLIKADTKSLEKAALREVKEETGVEAKIVKKIGTSIYSFTDPKVGKIVKFVTFYLMEYVKDLPQGFDWETAEIVWLPFDEAKKQLSFGGEKEMLSKASELL